MCLVYERKGSTIHRRVGSYFFFFFYSAAHADKNCAAFRETTIWDVRNKEVYSDIVQTPVDLTGISVFGSKGVLFTVSKDHTVQQYGLYPPTVTARAQYLPTVPPPSPPVSIEEKKEEKAEDKKEEKGKEQLSEIQEHQIERLNPRNDDYNLATMSPLGRIAHELELLEKMEAQGLGINNIGPQRTFSVSSRTTINVSRPQSVASTKSTRSMSIDQRSISDQRSTIDLSEYNMNSPVSRSRQSSVSQPQASPGRRPHPLTQEIIASPVEPVQLRNILDLFGNIKARLPFVTHDSPRIPSLGNKDEDELRREMLFTVFGWRGDVDSLIRDECKLGSDFNSFPSYSNEISGLCGLEIFDGGDASHVARRIGSEFPLCIAWRGFSCPCRLGIPCFECNG